MNDPDADLRQAVALFRYGVIADVAHLPPGSPGIGETLRAKAEQIYVIPGSRRTRVAVATMRDWLKLYRKGGFDALHPKPRADLGQPRRLPTQAAELLIAIKTERPAYSVRKVIDTARARLSDETPLPPSTVYRLLRREGLLEKRTAGPLAVDRRRFAYKHAGELWMLWERSHSIQYGNPIVMGT